MTKHAALFPFFGLYEIALHVPQRTNNLYFLLFNIYF